MMKEDVKEIVHSDNGKMISLTNVTHVTLLVTVVPVQTTTNVVVVLNQDTYKKDIVLIHVLYPDIMLMTTTENVDHVTKTVKNVCTLLTEIVSSVTLVCTY
jgi:hypothetical protein